MFPIGFALGAVTGAAAVLIVSKRAAGRARPVAKAALKAALMAYHEARTQGAELAEAAEDLFAEAKADAVAEVFAAAMSAATGKTAEAKKQTEKAPLPDDDLQAQAAKGARHDG